MTGPRRLRDDPAFRLKTGCDLSVEADLLQPVDLAAQRARLLSTVGGTSAGIGIAGLLAAGVGAVVAGGLLVALLRPQPAPEVLPAMPPAPAEVQLIPEAPPVVEPVAPAPAADRPKVVPEVVAVPEVVPVDAPPASSPVQAQLAAYDRGVVLMDGGQLAAAEAHFADMLSQWPDGVLVTEVRLARLDCLYRLKRWEDVVDAAEELKLSGDAGAEVIRMQHDAIEQGRSEQ